MAESEILYGGQFTTIRRILSTHRRAGLRSVRGSGSAISAEVIGEAAFRRRAWWTFEPTPCSGPGPFLVGTMTRGTVARLFLDANILFSAAYRPDAGIARLRLGRPQFGSGREEMHQVPLPIRLELLPSIGQAVRADLFQGIAGQLETAEFLCVVEGMAHASPPSPSSGRFTSIRQRVAIRCGSRGLDGSRRLIPAVRRRSH